jgi:hypothetical protein
LLRVESAGPTSRDLGILPWTVHAACGSGTGTVYLPRDGGALAAYDALTGLTATVAPPSGQTWIGPGCAAPAHPSAPPELYLAATAGAVRYADGRSSTIAGIPPLDTSDPSDVLVRWLAPGSALYTANPSRMSPIVYLVRGTRTASVFTIDSPPPGAGITATATVAGLGPVVAVLPQSAGATTFYGLQPPGRLEQLTGAAGSLNYLVKAMVAYRGRALYLARAGVIGEWFPSGLACDAQAHSVGVGDGIFLIDLLDGSYLAGGTGLNRPALSVIRPRPPDPAAPCQ